MLQVVQSAGGGPVEVVEAPAPALQSTQVLVATEATLISAGTERAVTQLAQSSLLQKAKARPDLVRQVITKARTDGLRPTIDAVRSRLADDLALGYSGAGTVVEVGPHVRGLRVGDRVATAGGGYASHAEYQAVPWVLASKIGNLDADQACFATVASVGLHGFRQAEVGVGSKVLIVGLGLIGQLTARMAIAAGCDVAGVDVRDEAIKMAAMHDVFALHERGAETTAQLLDWSRGRGVDAVIITAGGHGDSTVIRRTPERARDRATVVAVGDVGLDLDRNDFYHKELELRLARSYGPGRYDRTYEEWAVDYPEGYVRWTEGRNLEAVIDLLAQERIDIGDLITHRVPIKEAVSAYELLEDPGSGAIGVVLQYNAPAEAPSRRLASGTPKPSARKHSYGVGVLGAGLFVKGTILPGLQKAGVGEVVHIASSSGVSAARVAQREGIPTSSSSIEEVLADDAVSLVVVATPHSTHGDYTARALEAGKDVYCEKPLALTHAELDRIEKALESGDRRLYVGFNRRHSPMVKEMVEILSSGSGPIQIHYRVNAGPLPASHWYADRREGGRLHGEVCHFFDTCNALVGDLEISAAHLLTPNSDQHDSYHLLIGYADGSSASITYSAGANPATPKEWCEVTGRGHTLVLDNYRELIVNGKRASTDSGKGHVEGIATIPLLSATATTTALSVTRSLLNLSAGKTR